jgi:DNA ligase-1
MKFVGTTDVRRWLHERGDVREMTRGIGSAVPDPEYLEEVLGLPRHLQFVVAHFDDGEHSALDRLSSISFYSLCRGLLLPLSRMHPDRAAQLFEFRADPPPDTAGREALVDKLFATDIGISAVQKLGCLLGDPFHGENAGFKRDSLMRLLSTMVFASRRELLDRLARVGDPAILFAETRPSLRPAEPVLTAAEVLWSLQLLPLAPRREKFEILRSLYERCGTLEAYFITRLCLRQADFGFEYEGATIARVLARIYEAPPESVAHAIALSDTFHVANALAEKGPAGLQEVRLRPLVAIRPALASGTTETIKKFPVWVERKYDGIRLMLHKSTDERGSVLCGAYTRGRRDWIELVDGLANTIRMFPCRETILDGELYGTVMDLEGVRPASVYELYARLHGERQSRPVQMRYAAFDVLYVDGRDLTGLPLSDRRRVLQMVAGPMANMPTMVPVVVAEGQLANDKTDVSRLYQHFRGQGYEGVIVKDLDTPYALARRDPTWLKRKPAITLDLVLLGAVFAVTRKATAGTFGSFVIGAKNADGGFTDVGDVAGLAKARDADIQAQIMRAGLITGQRIERQSASGVRPGLALRPHIVVTVRFEGIVKDSEGGTLKLRDPKLVSIRSDKHAGEANSVEDIEELYLRQRMG